LRAFALWRLGVSRFDFFAPSGRDTISTHIVADNSLQMVTNAFRVGGERGSLNF